MAERANIQGRKVNHSGRKTFATTLLQNGRPITEVAQLGGWMNANINNTSNQMANKHDNPMSLFCGATVTGGIININVYSGERKHTINCSQ